MADIVSPATRSRMMAGIKGKDTRPERMLRSALHGRGLRYRIHYKGLPGRPDMVFPRYRAAVLIHGCFWHGHACHLFKWPATRPEFWRHKIESNKARDLRNLLLYRELGWRILTVWECALKGREKLGVQQVAELATQWLDSDNAEAVITGARGLQVLC